LESFYLISYGGAGPELSGGWSFFIIFIFFGKMTNDKGTGKPPQTMAKETLSATFLWICCVACSVSALLPVASQL
jgi:uncharacterized membrane-anchored protein